MMGFTRTFHALRRYGFSGFKAAEIVLDAIRGDKYARSFVGLAFKQRHG